MKIRINDLLSEIKEYEKRYAEATTDKGKYMNQRRLIKLRKELNAYKRWVKEGERYE